MGLLPLSKMDDYELVDKDQDLRGWKVQDATGNNLGKVAEMMVDTDKERVTTLLLDNNAEYPIEDLELGDHVLWLAPQGRANVVPLAGGALPSSPSATAAAAAGMTPGAVSLTGVGASAGASGAAMTSSAAPVDSAVTSPGLAKDSLQSELRVPVIEEQLRVGKRQVERGGVRVTRRVQDRPVQKQVELREEHVDVTRRAVDRPVDRAAVSALADLDIEVVEKAEVPVVFKQERVIEEVVVKKAASEHVETVRDVVRRTDVEVHELPSPPSPPSPSRLSH